MSGAVIIGCSAGGLEAVEKILCMLPPTFPVPVIVVQHQPAGRVSQLADLLARHCQMPVKEADEKELALPGHVYTAPPDYHLLIERDHTFALSVDEEVHHARPSIDVSFEAAADAYGRDLVGVVLTGADGDGARGLRAVEERGGLAVVQSPADAYVATMPEAAIAATRAPHVLPVSEIGKFLLSHLQRKEQLT